MEGGGSWLSCVLVILWSHGGGCVVIEWWVMDARMS